MEATAEEDVGVPCDWTEALLSCTLMAAYIWLKECQTHRSLRTSSACAQTFVRNGIVNRLLIVFLDQQ